MKIAIQANPNRGKEIISLFESLGGINSMGLTGKGQVWVYYIDEDDKIKYGPSPIDYKVHTLEEFKEEFPFKVGDLCIYSSDITGEDIVVKILGMTIENDCIMYEVGHRNTTNEHSYIYREGNTLKPYKEMKEERNVTLILDKAKEWYKKGGELKEIALQAYSEEELSKVDLPKTWEEFYQQYEFKHILNHCLSAINTSFSIKYVNKFEAFVKLQYLRDCWRQGWIYTFKQTGYSIKFISGKLGVHTCGSREFLSFPTMKMAEEFLEYFRDLIEQAGDLV